MAGVAKYLLVLVVLAVCGSLWLRRLRRRATHATPPQDQQIMVRCAHCGVHVPHAQALRHRGRDYCCVAHCNSDFSS